jgi:hypothetical protein
MRHERPEKPTLKVVMQYRSGQSKIYEIENAGTMVDVHVSPRESSENAGDWLVQAHSSRASDAVVIAEWGATRAEALREVGRTWTAKAGVLGLPAFDWDAVATLLLSVRAI